VQARTLIGQIRREDEPRREQIARQFVKLPEGERIWGKDMHSAAGNRTKKRTR
jgi:hypothetical protein